MIYLNQAATTYPKPDSVIKAVERAISLPPHLGNRGFGDKTDIIKKCKCEIADLFNIKNADRIYFTSGATDSSNRIINGLQLNNKNVITTQTEHNAILRPLYNSVKCNLNIIPCNAKGELNFEEYYGKIDNNVDAVFVNHCSNVTGIALPLKKMASYAKQNGALFIVDASQSAGMLDIDVEDMGIDILIFTGHKGLYGPSGTGGYYVRDGINLKPSVYGGTGLDSELVVLPDDYSQYEVGTQNLVGIEGLLAGINFIQSTGIDKIRAHEHELINLIKDTFKRNEKVTVYGSGNSQGSVISFNLAGLAASDTAYILANSYDCIVRSGLHCAPLIHNAIGTKKNGTVRVSVSYFNTIEEVNEFLNIIDDICASL